MEAGTVPVSNPSTVAPADPSQALDELFKESAGELTRYFSRRHGTVDLVPDLVQETFLQMARRVKNGQPFQNARAYLFGIARHISQAAWSRKPQQQLTLTMNDEVMQIAVPTRDDRIDFARETIAALPALQREILELRFTQNLAYQEIADVLGIPLGTVRSRLHHAISQVRQRIEEEQENL